MDLPPGADVATPTAPRGPLARAAGVAFGPGSASEPTENSGELPNGGTSLNGNSDADCRTSAVNLPGSDRD
jgi:hypothetical protein